jgi:hypothetical protein
MLTFHDQATPPNPRLRPVFEAVKAIFEVRRVRQPSVTSHKTYFLLVITTNASVCIHSWPNQVPYYRLKLPTVACVM